MSIETEIITKMMASTELQHHLDEFAGKVVDYAKDLAPVFGATGHDERRGEPPHGEPGDYRDSIHVEPSPRGPNARRVISRDYKAVWIELGSRHMPEYAVFAKTAAYFGGTGPDFTEEIHEAQGKLRGEVAKLEKMLAVGTSAALIAEQRREVDRARMGRSAAFKAARGPRRRRR